jgi:hypothetical protein
MVVDDLSRVEESATKSTYKLGVGFERCEDKGEKSALKFISSSTYHQEEKLSNTPKLTTHPTQSLPIEEVFVCMFCGRAGHMDRFGSRHKSVGRRCFDYARNSYRDEFSDFPPRSFSRALPHTSSRALPQFTHGPNHCSYGFGSRENCFESRRFGYSPRPHHADHFPHRPIFPARGSHTHLEPRHLNGPRFPRRGSRPTGSSGEVLKIVKTSSGHMVKCCIPKIYLTNPSTEPSTSSCPM